MIHYHDPRLEAEMFIHEKMLSMVAFLCLPEGHPRGQDRKPVGTAFFVHVFNENRSRAHGYLVTAKHVIDMNFKESQALLRMNDLQSSGVIYFPITEPWRFHVDPSVDLAVVSFGHGVEYKHRSAALSVSVEKLEKAVAEHRNTAAGGSQMWPPKAGEDLFLFALLPDVAGNTRNFPIVRRGWMASNSTEKINGYYGPSDYYVADIQGYFGHSGGPVHVTFQTNTFPVDSTLLGVFSSAYTADSADERGRSVSLAISLVTPIEKVIELLMSDELKADRKKLDEEMDRNWGRTKLVPLGVPSDDTEETFTQEDFLDALKRVSRKKQSDEGKSGT